MTGWARATWRTDNAIYLHDHRGRFYVIRHGEGRKYWGVQYPDGTYTHNALTQAEAKTQAETWTRDASLVALVDDVATDVAAPPADGQRPLPSSSTSRASAAPTAAALTSTWLDDCAAEFRPPRGSYGGLGKNQGVALGRIQKLVELREIIDEYLILEVSRARTDTAGSWYSNAATWENVGAALGITKQGAMSKYGSKIG